MASRNKSRIIKATVNIIRNQLVSFAAGFYLRKLRSLTGDKKDSVKKILLMFLAVEAIIQSYFSGREIGNALQDELLNFGTNDEEEGEDNE